MKNFNRMGKQSVVFASAPRLISSASIVSDLEGAGPLGSYFDHVLDDDTWGEKTWEKAECKMFSTAVRMALDKAKLKPDDVTCLLGGDLLNQIITANFAARELNMPFLGLYGACSTMAESLLVAGMMTDGGFSSISACVATSHFSTAERQYRLPLEMGSQATPTAQRTVTGAGCVLMACGSYGGEAVFSHAHVAGGTIGRVVDLGITDASNMGAAMAPAAADTLVSHLRDMNRTVTDYDVIITGDLGTFGSEMFVSLCRDKGVDILDRHMDCGVMIMTGEQRTSCDAPCGGSGCGCSAVTLASYLLHRLDAGDFSRMLFMATGALMSPTAGMQGESIPGVAHAVIIERM